MKFLHDKLNEKVDHYNLTCYEWSKGYRKAILDVIEYILNNARKE